MASLCMPAQTQNYQQFQLTNGNIMLLQHNNIQQQQQQQQSQQQQQHQHIAPKVLGTSNLQNIQTTTTSGVGAMLLAKKKYSYGSMPYPTVGCGGGGEQLPSVARRNARERNRVKQVNNGFVNLRQHIPQTVINALSNGGRGASKKLSKVDTLRIAVEYIRGLQDLLEESQPDKLHLHQHQHHQHNFHSDESSNDGSYAYSSMGSPEAQQYSQLHNFHAELSPSPTPSYSDSSDAANASNSNSNNAISYMQQIKLESQEQQQFKFEPFDSFSDEQPDDEELLDYISSWQEQ